MRFRYYFRRIKHLKFTPIDGRKITRQRKARFSFTRKKSNKVFRTFSLSKVFRIHDQTLISYKLFVNLEFSPSGIKKDERLQKCLIRNSHLSPHQLLMIQVFTIFPNLVQIVLS